MSKPVPKDFYMDTTPEERKLLLLTQGKRLLEEGIEFKSGGDRVKRAKTLHDLQSEKLARLMENPEVQIEFYKKEEYGLGIVPCLSLTPYLIIPGYPIYICIIPNRMV
jgi:hypothetical protein